MSLTFGSKKPVGLRAEIMDAAEETYSGAIVKLAGLFCKVIDLLLTCERDQFYTYWTGQMPIPTIKQETKKSGRKKTSSKKA